MKTVAVILVLFFTSEAFTNSNIIKGVRFDPGYIYANPNFFGLSAQQIAKTVVQNVKMAGFNTIFLFAYSSYYGAYYNTTYSMTTIEPSLGINNITTHLINEARTNGIKVIADLPMNNFYKVWQTKPLWRMKDRSGHDYQPTSDHYLLSIFHPEFKNWYLGFISDFLIKHPNIDGIEIFEPTLDFKWNNSADYSPFANKKYYSAFSHGELGSPDWEKFQSSELTTFLGSVFNHVLIRDKESYVVQTWPALPDGSLLATEALASASAFNFKEISCLPVSHRPTYIQGEFMWAQWASEYGEGVFNPDWIKSAINSFLNQMLGQKVIIHTELTEFTGNQGTVKPTREQFLQELNTLQAIKVNFDVYDYHQITEMNLWLDIAKILN